MPKASTAVIILLLVIVGLLVWMLFVKQAEAPSIPATKTTPSNTKNLTDTTSTASPVLHERVSVTYPKPNANVPKKFRVTGEAPGNWFFEASAPVMVRTPDGDKVAQSTAQTDGDWMTTKQVKFHADVTINPAYSGAATLVLLKDNPSGLPENDDSLEIPIVVE